MTALALSKRNDTTNFKECRLIHADAGIFFTVIVGPVTGKYSSTHGPMPLSVAGASVSPTPLRFSIIADCRQVALDLLWRRHHVYCLWDTRLVALLSTKASKRSEYFCSKSPKVRLMADVFARFHGAKLLGNSTTLAHCFSLPAWYSRLPASFSPLHYRLPAPRWSLYLVCTRTMLLIKAMLTKTSHWVRYLDCICMLGDFCRSQATFNAHSHLHQGQRPRIHRSVRRWTHCHHVLFRHEHFLGHGNQYVIRHPNFVR